MDFSFEVEEESISLDISMHDAKYQNVISSYVAMSDDANDIASDHNILCEEIVEEIEEEEAMLPPIAIPSELDDPTSLHKSEEPEDRKLLETQTNAINDSEMIKTMNVPFEICHTIGEYSNGYFIYCFDKHCVEKEFSILQSELLSLYKYKTSDYGKMYGNKDKFICKQCTLNLPYYSSCCNEPAALCSRHGCHNTLCSDIKCAQQSKQCAICGHIYCNKSYYAEYRGYIDKCGEIIPFQCWICGNDIEDECDDCSGHCYDFCQTRFCYKCRQKSWSLECVTCSMSVTFNHPKCGLSTRDDIWSGNPGWGHLVFVKCGCFQCKKYICLACECEIDIKNQAATEIDDVYYCLQHKNWIKE